MGSEGDVAEVVDEGSKARLPGRGILFDVWGYWMMMMHVSLAWFEKGPLRSVGQPAVISLLNQ